VVGARQEGRLARGVTLGPEGLHPKRRRGRPDRPPQLDTVVESQVIAWALGHGPEPRGSAG
jgi:hypothetical protein